MKWHKLVTGQTFLNFLPTELVLYSLKITSSHCFLAQAYQNRVLHQTSAFNGHVHSEAFVNTNVHKPGFLHQSLHLLSCYSVTLYTFHFAFWMELPGFWTEILKVA